MKTIAVDFDGTLCENKYPSIGSAKWDVIVALKDEQRNGAKLILWTCRQGEYLDKAVSWCYGNGLIFDAINDNLPEHIESYGCNSRKVCADEYWEDRAVKI